MTDILTRLSDEADQCRNDGADDIARLLDEARTKLEAAQAPTDDGGPAFPLNHQAPGMAPEFYYGMTLRDWFAGQALSGIEASQGNSGHFVSTSERVAARAYELADSMLKARGTK
jgi:hypothetical protein